MGRFLTEDPVFGDLSDPPSLHWYTYGKVNPTVFVDPDGRFDVTLEEHAADRQSLQTSRDALADAEQRLARFEERKERFKDRDGEVGPGLTGPDPTGEVNRLRHEVQRLEKRVADGEEFLTEIFIWLEDQRDPGQTWENQHYIFQTSLRLYLTHEKGVPGRGRDVRIVSSILGPEANCNNLCQFHKGFEGIGYVAEITEACRFQCGSRSSRVVLR